MWIATGGGLENLSNKIEERKKRDQGRKKKVSDRLSNNARAQEVRKEDFRNREQTERVKTKDVPDGHREKRQRGLKGKTLSRSTSSRMRNARLSGLGPVMTSCVKEGGAWSLIRGRGIAITEGQGESESSKCFRFIILNQKSTLDFDTNIKEAHNQLVRSLHQRKGGFWQGKEGESQPSTCATTRLSKWSAGTIIPVETLIYLAEGAGKKQDDERTSRGCPRTRRRRLFERA